MLYALGLCQNPIGSFSSCMQRILYIGLNASMHDEILLQVLNWQMCQDSSEFRAFG